jgi:hypothetical protein
MRPEFSLREYAPPAFARELDLPLSYEVDQQMGSGQYVHDMASHPASRQEGDKL